MIEVTTTYDTQNNTWNVMEGMKCIFFGSIDGLEEWLVENKDKYYEQ